MTKTDIAALLALGAAFFIAIGNVVQQRSAQQVTNEPVGYLQLFLRLLTDRRWWLGGLVAAAWEQSSFRAGSLAASLPSPSRWSRRFWALPSSARRCGRGRTGGLR